MTTFHDGKKRNLPARVEIIVDAARHRGRDARRLFEILERRAAHRPRGAEMHQQGALAARADAGDVVERVGGEALGALLRGARRSRSGAPRRAAAGGRRAPASWAAASPRARRADGTPRARRCGRALGDRRPPARRGRRHPPAPRRPRSSWPLPPSISSRSGQSPLVRSGSSFSSRAKRRREHLAHHREIVARRGLRPLDVELAILVLAEALGPGDDHRADRVGAHDVAVVIDLDPLAAARAARTVRRARAGCAPGCVVSASRRSSASSALRCACRISLRLLAALRHLERHLALGALGQRLGEQARLGQRAVEQDQLAAAALPRRTGRGSSSAPRPRARRRCAPGRSCDAPNSGRRG